MMSRQTDTTSMREESLVSRVNIGFVGFGNQAAKQHARYLVENCPDKVNIVAICDILNSDVSSVRKHLEQLGLTDVPIYTSDTSVRFDPSDIRSIEKLLAYHPELTAIIISTPSAKHYYQAKICLEKHLHVLVDKPLALSYEHGKQLVRLAHHSCGPYLVVSSQRRYEDIYQYVKKAIEANELGTIINISSIISHPNDLLQGWHSDPDRAGGGALWNLGWHTLDTIVYLLDRKAISVDAEMYYLENRQVETHANVLIQFEGNLSVTLSANFGAPKNSVYERLQIWGTKGMVILDRSLPIYNSQQAIVTHQTDNGCLLEPPLAGAIAKRWAPTEAFIRLLTSIEYPQTTVSVVSTGADSLETVRVIEASYKSAKYHEKISLIEKNQDI